MGSWHPCKRRGRYEVTSLAIVDPIHRIDYDSEIWTYRWFKRGDIQVLRMEEIEPEENCDTISFVEYSMPVMIEFSPEAE